MRGARGVHARSREIPKGPFVHDAHRERYICINMFACLQMDPPDRAVEAFKANMRTLQPYNEVLKKAQGVGGGVMGLLR